MIIYVNNKGGFQMKDNLKKMLEYNRIFVEHGMYQRYETTKYPDKKIAILSCMDTRLTELLPAALGLKNGDVKLIKNAGARIMEPYDSAMFSLIVAIYELDVDTIMVVGHDECGGQHLNGKEMVEKMISHGISEQTIEEVNHNHKNIEQWLTGFCDLEKSVLSTVKMIQNHPLVHKNVEVYGFAMHSKTGALRVIE